MFRNDNSGISLDVPKKETIFKRCVFNSASELKRSLSEILHGDSRKKIQIKFNVLLIFLLNMHEL